MRRVDANVRVFEAIRDAWLIQEADRGFGVRIMSSAESLRNSTVLWIIAYTRTFSMVSLSRFSAGSTAWIFLPGRFNIFYGHAAFLFSPAPHTVISTCIAYDSVGSDV